MPEGPDVYGDYDFKVELALEELKALEKTRNALQDNPKAIKKIERAISIVQARLNTLGELKTAKN